MGRSFPALFVLAVAVAAGACSSPGPGFDASTDYRGVQPGAESGTGDAEPDGGPAVSTTMRLANMSPDLGQVDFCWRVAGATGFTGPVQVTVLDGGADASDAGSLDAEIEAGEDASEAAAADAAPDATTVDAGSEASADAGADATLDAAADATLDAPPEAASDAGDAASDAPSDVMVPTGPPVQVGFAAVSPLVQLPAAGTLELGLVAPGQLSCGSPLYIGRVTLDAGKSSTVTIMGLASVDAGSPSALSMVAFTDEQASTTTATVRFIHAAFGATGTAPAPPLGVRMAGTLLAPEVDPASVTLPSTAPPVDSLGYASVPSLTAAAPFELDTLGDADTHSWTTGFIVPGLLPGIVHTGFIVSLPQGALGLVWCGDVSTIAGTSSCQLLTAR